MNKHRWQSVLTLAVLSFALALSCPAQTNVSAREVASKVDAYMDAATKIGRFSGSVLIARNGELLVDKGYGMANLELDVPNTAQTKYRLGSITKQFTAAAILLLQERGRLSVQDSVCKYVPECPAIWQPITLNNLLTHTSGIPNITAFPDFANFMLQPSTPLRTIERFRDKPLSFTPGEKFSYSNSNYVVLGYVVEKTSGKSYETFLRENIFEPLRMANTGYDHNDQVLKNRAAGYTKLDNGYANATYINMSLPYAAGGLYSTTGDLYLWDQALYTSKLLQQKSLDKMFTPFKDEYGYGWIITKHLNRKLIWHNGGINGFTSHLARYTDDKVTIIALGNLDTAATDQITRDLGAIVFGEKYELPVEHREIKVDPKVYELYIGQYEIAPSFLITVTKEADKLMGQATNQPKVELFPESETKFFTKVVDGQITFVKDEGGHVTHLILNLDKQEIRAKKIK